jgi:1-acyl-sn-glycerol-3-phosphate acyltransferase
MSISRSLVFGVAAVLVTAPYGLFSLLTFPFRPLTRYRIITSYTHIMLWLVWHVLGIRYRVLGQENIPKRASVILSKHQSAWETLALQAIFPPLSFVLKRELLRVPFLGWGLAQLPMIAIDRAAGKDALGQVVEQGTALLSEGFWVVLFPEGTRVAPGVSRRYKPGGAWLAQKAGAPVVPVAHTAGEFWKRNAFLKEPGEITVSIGPPIDPAGLEAAEINERAEKWIEAEMRRLFPHHYGRSVEGSSAT